MIEEVIKINAHFPLPVRIFEKVLENRLDKSSKGIWKKIFLHKFKWRIPPAIFPSGKSSDASRIAVAPRTNNPALIARESHAAIAPRIQRPFSRGSGKFDGHPVNTGFELFKRREMDSARTYKFILKPTPRLSAACETIRLCAAISPAVLII